MAESDLSYLLDPVLLIDHFNDIRAATRFLKDEGHRSAISVVTRAEVLVGFDTKQAGVAAGFLNRFPTLPIDMALADLAAQLRRQYGWRLPDAFQAALASYHGLRLVTRNTNDFPPERFDFVDVPYRL